MMTSSRSCSAAGKYQRKMRISVAVCTYNGEKYISGQIRSILKQTMEVDEIIICDDNSTDKTKEILTEFAAENLYIKLVFNKENLGFVKNFEKAISQCSGDIIFLSDQDDIWVENKIEIMMRTFDENPKYSYIFSDANVVDETGKNLGYSLWESVNFNKKKQKKFQTGKQKEILIYGNYITGATLAFRSEIKKFIIPFSINFFHDHWIGLLISFIDSSGLFLNEKLINYRIHSNQVISIPNDDRFTQKMQEIKNISGGHLSNFENRIKQLNDIKSRLVGLHKLTIENKLLIKELIYYFASRNRMYTMKKKERLKLIWELFTKRYYRKYATSDFIALKDVVQKIIL